MVLYVAVHVSKVTMIFEGSTAPVGTSEIKMGLKGGGDGDAEILAGSGGTWHESSEEAVDLDFSEERREGAGAGVGGGARIGREAGGPFGGSRSRSS